MSGRYRVTPQDIEIHLISAQMDLEDFINQQRSATEEKLNNLLEVRALVMEAHRRIRDAVFQ